MAVLEAEAGALAQVEPVAVPSVPVVYPLPCAQLATTEPPARMVVPELSETAALLPVKSQLSMTRVPPVAGTLPLLLKAVTTPLGVAANLLSWTMTEPTV